MQLNNYIALVPLASYRDVRSPTNVVLAVDKGSTALQFDRGLIQLLSQLQTSSLPPSLVGLELEPTYLPSFQLSIGGVQFRSPGAPSDNTSSLPCLRSLSPRRTKMNLPNVDSLL